MAANDAQRNFRRLKLDTSGWQVPPNQDDVAATGIPVPASQLLGRISQLDVQPSHSVIPEEPEEEREECQDAQNGDDEVTHSSPHQEKSQSTSGRPQDGASEPVSIQQRTSRRRGGGRSMMQELAQSKNPTTEKMTDDAALIDDDETPTNGHTLTGHESPEQFRRGEPRWPLLQATTDELADEGRSDKENGTAPSSAASPLLEGSRTLGYFFFGDHSLSPSIATSPVQQFPTLSDSGVLPSPRVREGSSRRAIDRPSAVRRESRRSSAKSSLAKSPASSFLSQFGKNAAAPPEPDEDGQPIGDNGEYIIGRQIGFGGFSKIKEVYSLENHTQVMRAVKVVRKQVSSKNEEENERLQNDFGNEVSIWRLLKHPNLLPLVAVFTNSFATFCIMEMNTGGTLFDLVRSNRRRGSSTVSPRAINQDNWANGHDSHVNNHLHGAGLPLRLASHYLRQLGSALRYLHQDMHIVHRDIKLENCLISTQSTDLDHDPGMKLLLCDFGMADFITSDMPDDSVFASVDPGFSEAADENGNTHIIGPSDLSTNIDGSLEYASPELIRASIPLFTPCIDIWAFGVVSHALLTADLPFRHSLAPRVQTMILNGLWDRRPMLEACKENSPGFDLVTQCLEMDVRKRWAIQNVVDSHFLSVQANGDALGAKI